MNRSHRFLIVLLAAVATGCGGEADRNAKRALTNESLNMLSHGNYLVASIHHSDGNWIELPDNEHHLMQDIIRSLLPVVTTEKQKRKKQRFDYRLIIHSGSSPTELFVSPNETKVVYWCDGYLHTGGDIKTFRRLIDSVGASE